jgi:hypothetical protein
MKPSALLTLLFAIAALLGCADDTESPSNVPPDLKLEDVVGCWYRGGDGYCRIQCYDPSMEHWYQLRDSINDLSYEAVGSYWINGFYIEDKFIGSSNASGIVGDTIKGKTGLRRIGSYLYSLDDSYETANKYSPVPNLDSLPCGKPFTLLPKPANWTLF